MAVTQRQGSNSWKKAQDQTIANLSLNEEFAVLGVQITGSEPNADGWIECYAIGREDRNPSAAVNLKSGYYKDSGGDGKVCSLFDLAVKLGKFPDWKTARKHYAKKAGVKLPGGREEKGPAYHLKFRPWNDALISLWCNAKPGINLQAIKDFGGQLAKYRGQFNVIAFPIFGPELNNTDPVDYVIYQLNGHPLPVWQGKGKKPTGHVKMKTTAGSKSGLMGPFCSPTYNSTTVSDVWKLEGPADALAFWSYLSAESQATAIVVTNSGGANETPKDSMAGPFKEKLVFLVHDADQAGENGASKWLPWLSKFAREVRHIKLPYEIEPNHGKDVRDFLTADGTIQQLFELAENAPIYKPDKKPTTLYLTDDGNGEDENRLSSTPPEIVAFNTIDSYFTVQEAKTLWHWRKGQIAWGGGAWLDISKDDLEAKINKKIMKDYSNLTNSAFNNVMTQIRRSTKLHDDIEPPFLLDDAPDLPEYVQEWDLKQAVFGPDGVLYLPWLLSRPDECFSLPSPSFFNLTCVASSVKPQGEIPEPKRWLKFLNSVWGDDPESIEAFRLWCGYLLTADISQQKVLLVVGPKRSGKGTIAGVLSALHRGCVANPTFNTLTEPFGLSVLLNKTIGIIGDARLVSRETAVVAERILAISGGDPLPVNRKHKDQLNVKLGCRLMIMSNELPAIYDASAALASRMIILPMTKSFYGEENLSLPAELRNELDGIFWWCVGGWLELQKRGRLFQPKSGGELARELEELGSPVLVFSRECCEVAPDYLVSKATLYDAYGEWCEKNGRAKPSREKFFRDLKSAILGLTDTRPHENGKRIQSIQGIRLNPNLSDAFDQKTKAYLS